MMQGGPSVCGALRRRRGPTLPALTLNMTAMIDVIFMLLVFFVFTVDFRPREDSLPLESPRAVSAPSGGGESDPFALPERPVLVTVRSTGDGPRDYALGTDEPVIGTPLNAGDLRSRAAAAKGSTLAGTQVFTIRSERDTRWEHTLAAFNALQQAGYREISLAAPPAGGR
jgi:biopolymer transport protein ExbD